MAALTYASGATVMIAGVGLMGQYMARNVADWIDLEKLVLVDQEEIFVAGERQALGEFAEEIPSAVAEPVDITNEDQIGALFARHSGIRYLMHTVGINPRPLTPPEELTKEEIMSAYEVNLWGAHNLLTQGIKQKAFSARTHGVIVLSTSATVGSEGRSSAAYEESKGGLRNLLTLQGRHFAEQHGLVLNGLAPSPLRGPMAAQNPTSAARMQAVEDATPLGGLVTPQHIAAATMYFWSNECWCIGEILTTDGGYTKHRPIYGGI